MTVNAPPRVIVHRTGGPSHVEERAVLARVTAFLVLIAILAACGGGSTTSPSPATSAAPSGQATPPVVTGDAIDAETVGAAVAALQAKDSWTFDVSTITMGLETGVRTTITGTERNVASEGRQGLSRSGDR